MIFLLAGFLFSGSDASGANFALQFDGGDFLSAAGNETLNPSEAITIEVWCMIPGHFMDLGNCPLIEKPFTSHQSPWYQYHMGVNSQTREFLFDLSVNGSRQLLRSPVNAFSYGEWVHVAGTFDGMTMRLFIDGEEVVSREVVGQLDAFEAELIIGRFGNFGDGIVGAIDEVRLWETARTPEQIQQMMCAKLSGSEAGLMAAWEFDEGSGQTTSDRSPNGHDATRGGKADSDAADPTWVEGPIPQCVVAAINVGVDVKPGSERNGINCNPRGKGVIPVAILTTPEFDATTIDHTTVHFGPAEAPEAHTNGHGSIRHETDIDGDGDLDLLFQFRFHDSGIQCGDTKVTLTGETYDGQAILGADLIETLWDGDKGLAAAEDIQVTPNPFNPKTAVSFTTEQSQRVRVVIYDIRGRLITNLTDQEYSAGEHSIAWQGRDSAGRSVPSGQYFFLVDVGGEFQIKKALLLR